MSNPTNSAPVFTPTRAAKAVCSICDDKATWRSTEVIDGQTVTVNLCTTHKKDVEADAQTDAAPTPTSKSTRNPKKETTVVTKPASKPARKSTPKAVAAMVTETKPRRVRKPATVTPDEAPAKPTRRRVAVKAQPGKNTKATGRTRGSKPAATEAPKDDATITYALGAEFDGMILYVVGVNRKDGQVEYDQDPKRAKSYKSIKALVKFAVDSKTDMLLNPFDDSDDKEYDTYVYTFRNGRKSTRKDDAPVTVASVQG